MENYLPTSFFYFSTCLKLESKETEIYHSILHVISNKNSSQEKMLLALENLIICDYAFQLYSLPIVLNNINRIDVTSPKAEKFINKYFQVFISSFEASLQPLIKTLFSESRSISNESETFNILVKATEALNSDFNLNNNSSLLIPYIDITQYNTESILLILISNLTKNIIIANQVKNLLTKENNFFFKILIESAANHKIGRFNFLESLKLLSNLKLINNKTDFFDKIWKEIRMLNCPLLEPDIVHFFLSVWFFETDNNLESEIYEKITAELNNFTLFYKCFNERPINFNSNSVDKNLTDHLDKLSTIYGIPVQSKYEVLQTALSIWIGSIFFITSEKFSGEYIKKFINIFWQPFDTIQEIDVSTKHSPGFILSSLYFLKIGPQRNSTFDNTKWSPSLISPWLAREKNKYLQVFLISNWIRNLYCIASAINTIEQSEDSDYPVLLQYLVHVSAQLWQANEVIKGIDSSSGTNQDRGYFLKEFSTYPNLRKILLILKSSIAKTIEGGESNSSRLNSFIELLKLKDNSSKWSEYFYMKTLPQILFNWYDSNFQNNGGELDQSLRVSQLEKIEAVLTGSSKYKLKIIKKFLYPEKVNPYDDSLNENNEHVEGPYKIYLYENDINKLDDIEFDKFIELPSNKKQEALAIIIKRYLLSVYNVQADCRERLLQILNEVKDPIDLSYLNRIGIISIFNNFLEIPGSEFKLLKLILEVIFKIGGLYDFQILFQKITQELMEKSENYELEEHHVDIIYELVEHMIIKLNYTIHLNRNKEKPIDPFDNNYYLTSVNFIRKSLNNISYLIRHNINIRNIEIVDTKKESFDSFQIEQCEATVFNDSPEYKAPKLIPELTARNISLISYNSDMQAAYFYIHNVDLHDDTISLFNLSKDGKNEYLSNKKRAKYILGIYAGKNDEQFWKFKLDNTFYKLVPIGENRLNDISIGDYVKLHYFFNNKGVFRISGEGIQNIKKKTSNNETFYTFKDLNALKEKKDLDFEYWLPNHSDIFTGEIELQFSKYKNFYHKNYLPINGYFKELIKDIDSIKDILTLTFVEEIWDADLEKKGYLFNLRFGKNYIIFEDELICSLDQFNCSFKEFIIRSNGLLDNNFEMIHMKNEFNGLLISFKFNFTGGLIKLSPVDEQEIYNNDRFPDLKLPIDHRNIQWKNLFNVNEENEFIAENVNKKWIFKTDAKWKNLKFPGEIFIDLKLEEEITDEEVEFALSDWLPYNQRFSLCAEGTLIQRQTIDSFNLLHYLALKENDKVIVEEILSSSEPTLTCNSKSKFKASINREELTFIPKSINNFKDHASDREFYVEHISGWIEVSVPLEISGFKPDMKYINNNSFIGYFLRVNKPENNIASCSICLIDSHNNLSHAMDIKINKMVGEIKKYLSTFARIRGELNKNGTWKYLLDYKIIDLRANWEIETNASEESNYFYLGKIKYSNSDKYLFEDQDRNGVLLVQDYNENMRTENVIYENISKIKTAWKFSKKYQKGFFQVSSRKYYEKFEFTNSNLRLYGYYSNNKRENQSFILNKIYFELEPDTAHNKYFVKRMFVLGINNEINRPSYKYIKAEQEKLRNEQKRKLFEDYFKNSSESSHNSPDFLYGEINLTRLTVTISNSSVLSGIPINNDYTKWTDVIKLHNTASEELKFPIDNMVFVPSAISQYDKKNVCFTLLKEQDEVFATFKKRYMELDDYYNLLRQDAHYNDIIDKSININNKKLYFAGIEEINPITQIKYAKKMYRFELGFGENLLVEEDRISFWNPENVTTQDLIIHHSDAVTVVKFTTDRNKVKLCVISIDYCEAFILYEQAQKKIHHVANIKKIKNKYDIQYIIGLGKSWESGSNIYTPRNSFLDSDSELYLNNFFNSDSDNFASEKYILVKVDIKKYKKDSSKIFFNFYKMTFDSNLEEKGCKTLRDDAKILMEFGNIFPTGSKNDYKIEVKPIGLIEKTTIGTDLSEGSMFRRKFSVDESILRNYWKTRRKSFFLGKQSFVKVSGQFNDNNQSIQYSLLDNLNSRDEKSLYGVLNNPEKNISGIVKNVENGIVLEIKPGIFIKFDKFNYNILSKTPIKKGDLINVMRSGDKFYINNALSGDLRFIVENRGVVILPNDSLKGNNIMQWKKSNGDFILGELQNIRLDLLDNTNKNKFEILSMPHPKMGMIKITEKGIYLDKFRDNSEQKTGYLEFDERSKNLYCISKENKQKTIIYWSNVTYQDESIATLVDKIRKYKWGYHDEQSFFIKLDNNNTENFTTESDILKESKLVEDNNFENGPVFFEIMKNEISLRHTQNLLKWAYPARSLFEFFLGNKESWDFSYVGSISNEIHFIELAPGRIVELPIFLLFFKNGNVENSLANYAWDFLSPGDMIKLAKPQQDLENAYKIEMSSIEHNLRNIISNKMIAPIIKVDTEEGYIEIGDGEFLLRLPFISSQKIGAKYSILDKKLNSLQIINRIQIPSALDTIFIKLNSNGRFISKGLETYKFVFQDKKITSQRLFTILKALKNETLPVQILEVKGKTIVFKMFSILTHIGISKEKFLSARVISSLGENSEDLILKIGGYIEIINYNKVISGVPLELRELVLDNIKNMLIWVRFGKNESSHLCIADTGIKKETSEEFFVKGAKFVSTDNKKFIGAICISTLSQKLYWLPMEEMAWAKLNSPNEFIFSTPDQIDAKSKYNIIKVKRIADVNRDCGHYISKIRTMECDNSFAKKKCGVDKATAIVISEPQMVNDEKTTILCYSIFDRTILECDIFEKNKLPQKNSTISIEISQKDLINKKIRATSGERKFKIFFPINNFTSKHFVYKPQEEHNSQLETPPNYVKNLEPEKITELIIELYHTDVLSQNSFELIKNLSSIIIKDSIFKNQLEFITLFALLILLCRYVNQFDSQSIYLDFIKRLSSMLKLAAIRNICFDNIKKETKDNLIFKDIEFYDKKLLEKLKSFGAPITYKTEKDISELKKLAVYLSLSNESKYRNIGISILVLLGVPVKIDSEYVNCTISSRIAKLLEFLSLNGNKKHKIDIDYITSLKEMYNEMHTNNYNYPLIDERCPNLMIYF